MPPKRNGPRGGGSSYRNKNTKRGGPNGRGRFDRGNRSNSQARGFRRDDSEGFRRRSPDNSPRREGFRRRSPDNSPRREGFNKKPPRYGQRPKDNNWKDQSQKPKGFWRDPPDVNKNKIPTRNKGKQSFDEFPRPMVPKQGGKNKPKKKDSDSEYMTQDSNQYLSDSAFSGFEESEDEGTATEYTDDEMQQEMIDRDYKQVMEGQKRKPKVKLRDDKDYKSSDENFDSDVEQFSSTSSDDLMELDDEESGVDQIEDHNTLKDERPKLSNQSEEKKSSGRATITETEWDDFLQKNVYENSTEDKTDVPTENVSKENIQVEDKKIDQSISKKEEEAVRNRVVALRNRWKWFQKLTKEITDEQVILPKELLDEVDEEKLEEEENIEGEENIDKTARGQTIKDIEEFLAAEKNINKLNDNSFQQAKQLYMDIPSKQPPDIESSSLPSQSPETDIATSSAQNLETDQTPTAQAIGIGTKSLSTQPLDPESTPSLQTIEAGTTSISAQTLEPDSNPLENTMESESILPSVQTIESGKESIHPQISVPETESDTKKPEFVTVNELPKTSKDDTESDDGFSLKQIPVVFTDDAERLRDDWHRFISVYEQSTGVLDHDLPYDLPNEEDEEEEDEEHEPKIDVPPKLEPLPSPALDHLRAAIIPKEGVSEKSACLENSEEKPTSEKTDDFDGDPGFGEMYDREEKEKDKDINSVMYETYKITGTPEEFFEDHPELRTFVPDKLPANRPVLQWHHFKELWNRFVDNVTDYPGRAFEEYDKIIEAKDRALKKGIDITEELNLTSVPEKKEPMAEYQKTEAELRAAWRKYEREAAHDTQQGLFEAFVDQGEIEPKPDDDLSPEADQTLRAVVSLLDHPERFDMNKFEASLTKEEIQALHTGEYANKTSSDPNANSVMDKDNDKRNGMAQKMWEYFVNMMRQRHEKELEKFLSLQPRGTVPLGDNPDDVKELWQKYINYTTSAQPITDGKGPGEMEYLWSSASPSVRTTPTPPMNERLRNEVPEERFRNVSGDSQISTNGTQGWNNLRGELESLRERAKRQQYRPSMPVADVPYDRSPMPQRMERVNESNRPPYVRKTDPSIPPIQDVPYDRSPMPQRMERVNESNTPPYVRKTDPSVPPVQETTVRRGWDVLGERMKNAPAQKTDDKSSRTLHEAEDRKRMEYFYEKQFPDSDVRSNYQTHQPSEEYNNFGGMPPPQQRTAPPPPRGNIYNYEPYPGLREHALQAQNPYSWQYNAEVNQIASTPFGHTRQPAKYNRSPDQYAPDRRQVPFQRTNVYNRGYDQNIPRDPQINRRSLGQVDSPPLDNAAFKTPMFEQRTSTSNSSYSQQMPRQMEKSWTSAQEQVSPELKPDFTKRWQRRSGPYLQHQDESWSLRRPNEDYRRSVVNQNGQPSRDLYDMGSKKSDCIHITHQDNLSTQNLERQFDAQTSQTGRHTTSNYDPNISFPKSSGMSNFNSNSNPN